ncbi:hypothetical protein WJX84_007882 [Apatococcus fuscideae]|uniref:Uncharacterized protein n=1 Tax=Apatococcus fuscideae TaxID=2026836 RepID=A0AAW1STQ5_9CHLO
MELATEYTSDDGDAVTLSNSQAQPAPAPRSWRYKLTNHVKEDHGQPVYCITYNHLDGAKKDVFASCGGRRLTIYECGPGGVIELLQAYVDAEPSEEFFTCRWTLDEETQAPVLLVAGKLGVMRVIDCHTCQPVWDGVGHGNAINDIAVHPKRPSLVITASRDQSLRLWNLRTHVCALVATGDGSHRNEVLSIDFHPHDEHKFLSCGMDDTIKIWSLKGAQKDIDRSDAFVDAEPHRAFQPGELPVPEFSTHKVHWDYVDCVRWLGDLVLSKSVDNRIILWMPDESSAQSIAKGRVKLVQEYKLEEANVWFVRFCLDPLCTTLACGNRNGTLLLWDPNELRSQPRARLKRPASATRMAVSGPKP